jgi:hypothetical protein
VLRPWAGLSPVLLDAIASNEAEACDLTNDRGLPLAPGGGRVNVLGGDLRLDEQVGEVGEILPQPIQPLRVVGEMDTESAVAGERRCGTEPTSTFYVPPPFRLG